MTINLPFSFFQTTANSSPAILHQLLEFSSTDLDLKHLVWCAYAAHYESVPKEKISAFLRSLDNWKECNFAVFENSETQNSFSESLDQYSFPPPCYEKITRSICLPLALYSFYRARLLWALCLLGDEDGKLERDVYFHIYQLLRYVRTALEKSLESLSDDSVPSENLRIGFLPLLYLAGRCCPNSNWLRWIIQELGNVGNEGLFNSQAFATTLNVLCQLEEHTMRASNLPFECQRFATPRLRMIALLIPDIDGRSFEAYFARPRESLTESEKTFVLFRIARWSSIPEETAPVIQDLFVHRKSFSRNWLLAQPLVQKWLDWNCGTEFNLDQVIQDHIIGNRPLLEVGTES